MSRISSYTRVVGNVPINQLPLIMVWQEHCEFERFFLKKTHCMKLKIYIISTCQDWVIDNNYYLQELNAKNRISRTYIYTEICAYILRIKYWFSPAIHNRITQVERVKAGLSIKGLIYIYNTNCLKASLTQFYNIIYCSVIIKFNIFY